MYSPGELKIVGPLDDVTDYRNDEECAPVGSVYLSHSDGKWVIGGPEQIRALIADLQAFLE